ncbi:hypothetical protein CPB83DRAFT_893933 [Crepidotus variabilis]|uniref:Secreted protein n=1 Tax=Crepidotus variabilis TaxID=179855 RepID=A0A9P6EHD9_9AGAR|nr:hypothetical protein CPB83DRAFT_893933 [Crepidotus variabilis]
MKLNYILFVASQCLLTFALERRQDRKVFTATKVVHALVSQSPFFVDSTTTVVWTQSPSITEPEPTTAPSPTIDY